MSFRDFFNPRSMVMPAVLSGFIMAMTNTLWVTYGASKVWSSMTMSLFFMLIIIIGFVGNKLEKLLYLMVVSFVIFSLAVNLNYAGATIAQQFDNSEKIFKHPLTHDSEVIDPSNVPGLSVVNKEHPKANRAPVFVIPEPVRIVKRKFFDPYF